MIFIDAYTSWCGPCKWMVKEVFTKDEVADYYNKHFVCVKYDVEKDKAIPMNNPYGINSYPTFLYLTPDGQVVHKTVGSCKPGEFVGLGERAADKDHNLSGLERRYRAGENSPALLKEYTGVLLAAGSGGADRIAGEYMSGLSDKEFFSEENWGMIDDLSDPTAYPLLKARQSRNRFYRVVEPASVDTKLKGTFMKNIIPYLEKEPADVLDGRGHELVRLMQATGDETYFLHILLTRECRAKGEYGSLLDQMKSVCRYNILKKQTPAYCSTALKHFSDCRDKAVIHDVVAWLDGLCENEYYTPDFKASLQQSRKTLNDML